MLAGNVMYRSPAGSVQRTMGRYMYSPTSRTASPARILNDNSFQSKYPEGSSLSGNGSILNYDFGQEVGGLVPLNYSAVGPGTLGLAFTEA
jgi:hypothetical protein